MQKHSLLEMRIRVRKENGKKPPLTFMPHLYKRAHFFLSQKRDSWSRHAKYFMGMFPIYFLFFILSFTPVYALEAVRVSSETPAIDLTPIVEHHQSSGDFFETPTAPGPDGIVRRIFVKASETGLHPSWIVFALTNDTNEQIDRLLVAPYYQFVDSGVFWPDLGHSRIAAMMASQGVSLERISNLEADVFSLTLDPGTTVTFIAELHTTNLPQLYLWAPEAYTQKTNGLTLYKGIILGISVLLALFLTVISVVRGTIIFPAAAALAWAVLAYACLDFYFFQNLLPFSLSTGRILRAIAEAVLGATFFIFLFAYLNLHKWHVRYSYIAAVWLISLIILVGLATFAPQVASGIARLAIIVIAVIGFALIVHLATHGYERAIMLLPTWFVFLLWALACALAVSGRLTGDIIAPALMGGLVLVVMLIGLTVVQHAFAGEGAHPGLLEGEERMALAFSGSGDGLFDWDVATDYILVSPDVEAKLAMKRGALEGPASRWLDFIHPLDRHRYKTFLDSLINEKTMRGKETFRLQSVYGTYIWYALKVEAHIGRDGEVARIVGTLMDVTEEKVSQERLLYNAVYDSLTGLPKRQLFLDRLTQHLHVPEEHASRLLIVFIGIENLKDINDTYGIANGDFVLLTMSRRIGVFLKPQDTLCRFSGSQFALLLRSESDPEPTLTLLNTIRRAIATPITISAHEISVDASIGTALWDPSHPISADTLITNAQHAAEQARISGQERMQIFTPLAEMEDTLGHRNFSGTEIRQAFANHEIIPFFLPIVRLTNYTIIGFEAVMRWQHPKHGLLLMDDFYSTIEDHGLIQEFSAVMINTVVQEVGHWYKSLTLSSPLFCSVNITSHQLLSDVLANTVKVALARTRIPPSSLKIEVTERIAVAYPEKTIQALNAFHAMGVGIFLDHFGVGYTALSYLDDLPCEILKVDRSFLYKSRGEEKITLLHAIATLARDLKMDVIAEGIENEEDAQRAKACGCAYGQGFAFGRPLTSDETRHLIGISPV